MTADGGGWTSATPRRRWALTRMPCSWVLLTGLLAAVGAGCSLPRWTELPLATPGSYDASFPQGDLERSLRLHLPPQRATATRRPLLVALHGGGSSGEGMEEVTGFSRIADREGFVVVYPDGMGGPHGLGRAWNAGSCCGLPHWYGIDDVAFVSSILSSFEAPLRIDPDRVFLVGYSNGGLLAYRAAVELSDRLAAVGVFGATMPGRGPVVGPEFADPLPEHPLSVIAIHSYADPWVPYQGREQAEETDVSFRHVGQFWAVAADCPARPKRSFGYQRSVWIDRYRGCRHAVEIEQLTLLDWGHEWPGPANLEADAGHPLQSFDAAERMWAFFAGKRRVPIER